MLDRFKREINYLRISVTDRCNFRCRYCMPAEGIPLLQHTDILSYEEIMEVVRAGVKYGINKIRLTGGEPLIRKGIIHLVDQISNIPEITDLSITTNGVMLTTMADDLKKAGLDRVNISLDTINPEEFRTITRVGELQDVLNGIMAAKNAGFNPIKINCVIQHSPLEKNALEVAAFCTEHQLEIRYIKEMDLEEGRFTKVIGGSGGDCKLCNRLRLTANGDIKPCLFSDIGYNIRTMGVEKAILAAISNKPYSGTTNTMNKFSNIGG